MANKYSKDYEATGGAAFLQGFTNQYTKNKTAQDKFNYERAIKQEEQKNEFRKQFVLEKYRQDHEDTRDLQKQQHEDDQKALDRQAKVDAEANKPKKIKSPSMGEMMMLSTGKIPDDQKQKMNISDEDEQRFLTNLAQNHGWEPKEVPDTSTASGGFLGFGAHAPTRSKIVYSPPQGQQADPSLEIDTQDEQP